MSTDPTSRPRSDDELLSSAIPIDAAATEADAELEPVEIEQPRPGDTTTGSRIRAFGQQHHDPHENHWKRQPNLTGRGAIHVKTFYAKLRQDAIEHLDTQINQWLDSHEEYEVKFVTTSVGTLMGKNTEDAIFINVWV